MKNRQFRFPEQSVVVKVGHRKRINILTDRETIVSATSNTFGFSEKLYNDHDYLYPVQELTGTGDFINVMYRWSTEYYHFLTEALPNAMFCASRLPPSTPIVCGYSKFAEGLFRWFGLSNPIQYDVRGGGVTAKYVECGNPSHDTIQRLRDVIESKLVFTKTRGILIRRHGTRYLENEEEVLATFRGFYPELEWVVFDTLSAEETATLFSSAAVIVAPHGAGLTNMIFSSRGIRIYEFMPLNFANLCYTHLSSLLGNTYTMLPVEAAAPRFSMRPSLRELYLKNNTGQVQVQYPFGQLIQRYAEDPRFQRYMEIGSWNGKGSTICVGIGFLARRDTPVLHSLEINRERYTEASAFWEHNPTIRIHHARVLSELPDVRTVHSSIESEWQADDERSFRGADYLNPEEIAPEVVILDGGEYLTYFEFQKLKQFAKVFILDDTLVAKCKRVDKELSADPDWNLVASGTDRHGWAIYERL